MIRQAFPHPPRHWRDLAKDGNQELPAPPPLPPPSTRPRQLVVFGQVVDLAPPAEAASCNPDPVPRLHAYNATESADDTAENNSNSNPLALPPVAFLDSGSPPAHRLKALNAALLANYAELLDVLVARPDAALWKLGQLREVAVNLCQALNACRPLQARDTLKLLIQHQIADKKGKIERLRDLQTRTRQDLASARAAVLQALHEQSSLDGAAGNSDAAAPSGEIQDDEDKDEQEGRAGKSVDGKDAIAALREKYLAR